MLGFAAYVFRIVIPSGVLRTQFERKLERRPYTGLLNIQSKKNVRIDDEYATLLTRYDWCHVLTKYGNAALKL